MQSAHNSEEIYQILHSDIVSIALKPGARLSENDLCQRFGVSRTPIRSVLQRLQNDGLVQVVPYKGTSVTLLNFSHIRQMIYLRIAVESMVLRDFMRICTPINLEKIRYVIRKQTVLLDDEFSSAEFYTLDSQLHEIWFKLTGCEMLWDTIQKAQVNYTRFRMLDIVAAQNYQDILKEHHQLFALIESKQRNAVEDVVKNHLYGGIMRLGPKILTEYRDYFQPDDPEQIKQFLQSNIEEGDR